MGLSKKDKVAKFLNPFFADFQETPHNRFSMKLARSIVRELMSNGANITRMAEALGIDKLDYYYYLNQKGEKFDRFREMVELAKELGSDFLIDEAVRRGAEGVDKAIFYQGVECGVIREYSDGLLKFLIRGRRPEYAEKLKVSGPDGGAVPIDFSMAGLDLTILTEEELLVLKQIGTKLKAHASGDAASDDVGSGVSE